MPKDTAAQAAGTGGSSILSVSKDAALNALVTRGQTRGDITFDLHSPGRWAQGVSWLDAIPESTLCCALEKFLLRQAQQTRCVPSQYAFHSGGR